MQIQQQKWSAATKHLLFKTIGNQFRKGRNIKKNKKVNISSQANASRVRLCFLRMSSGARVNSPCCYILPQTASYSGGKALGRLSEPIWPPSLGTTGAATSVWLTCWIPTENTWDPGADVKCSWWTQTGVFTATRHDPCTYKDKFVDTPVWNVLKSL